MSHSKVSFVSILAFALAGAPALAFADPPPPRHHAAGLLEESLSLLSLRPDQRTKIAAIEASIGPSRQATKDARRALLDALAGEVDAGAVEPRSLGRVMAGAVQAEASERATERAALEQLHGVLDREERAEMARVMESRLAAWQPRETRAGELRRLASELKLSRAQRARVAAVLQADPIPHDVAPRAAKAAEHRIAEAFKSDDFVMEHVSPDDTRAITRARLGRLVALAQKVARVLGAEQRRLLAAKIRARAARGVMGL
jgi:hypothetical protein